MKQHYLKICILMVILVHENVSTCTYSEEEKEYNCDSPVEISVEGTEDWTNLLISDPDYTFTLKNNTFKRTPNLKKLSVGTLDSIEPGAFIDLKKLDSLTIFDSNFEEIPVGVLDNLLIRSIKLENTTTKISPGLFDNLPDIRKIDIGFNPIKVIKVGIFNNNSLIYQLYMDSNEIETIETGAFSNMMSLIDLSLSGNKLTSFDSQLLVGKPNSIQNFWLDRNKLTQITRNMFLALDVLRKLELDNNQIESIDDESFYLQQKMDFLDISNNKLKEIQPNIFATRMKELTTILMHNNQFTFFNNAIFIRTPSLKYISAGGNPFQCPCLDETKDWSDKLDITRLCDNEYLSGERPACLFSDIAKNKCIYDVQLTENLYELYKEALKGYPILNLKCDNSDDASHATLINNN